MLLRSSRVGPPVASAAAWGGYLPGMTGERSFGIDIGGSGMKAAPVDLGTGELLGDRHKILTPKPATPKAMAQVVRELVEHFDYDGPAGAVAHLGQPGGVVLVLTFGTGIGSGLFVDGQLVPNTELGHLELDGHDAETQAAASARDREDLSWKEWAPRVEHYLRHVVMLFSPSLIIVGGGASRKADKWLPLLDVDCEIVPATLTNEAGIVGAALVGSLDQPLT